MWDIRPFMARVLLFAEADACSAGGTLEAAQKSGSKLDIGFQTGAVG